jgi:hypothetical protein
MRSLKKVLYDTVHRRTGKTVEALADELGVSQNYLYRSCLPIDDRSSGCRFPLELLIPLMNSTGDYRVLKYLAHRTGHVVYRIPRNRQRTAADLNTHQKTFAEYFGALLQFFDGELDMDECLEYINRVLEEVAGFKKSVEKGRQEGLKL